jgi:hypothetical protein
MVGLMRFGWAAVGQFLPLAEGSFLASHLAGLAPSANWSQLPEGRHTQATSREKSGLVRLVVYW